MTAERDLLIEQALADENYELAADIAAHFAVADTVEKPTETESSGLTEHRAILDAARYWELDPGTIHGSNPNC